MTEKQNNIKECIGFMVKCPFSKEPKLQADGSNTMCDKCYEEWDHYRQLCEIEVANAKANHP